MSFEHNQIPEHESRQEEEALNDMVDSMVETYGLNEDIAESFKTGLSSFEYDSTAMDKRLTTLKIETLAELKECYDGIYIKLIDGFAAEALCGTPRSLRRQAMRDARNDDGRAIEVYREVEAQGYSPMEDAKFGVQVGIERRDLLPLITAHNVLVYANELGVDKNLQLKDLDSFMVQHAHNLTKADETPHEITIGELTRRLETRDYNYKSKEALDSRFYTFAAALQVESSAMFLNDLANYHAYGNATRRFCELAERHRAQLLTNDIGAKIAMHEDLAAAFAASAQKADNRQIERLLHTYAERSRVLAKEINDTFQSSSIIYDALGYERPESLRSKEARESKITKRSDSFSGKIAVGKNR